MKKIAPVSAGLIIAALSGCFYNLPTSDQTLHWDLVGAPRDTVSVFTSFTFAFSEALADSGVPVSFNPPFYEYTSTLNAARDTVTIAVAGQFQADTRYILRRSNVCRTARNVRLLPEDDSLVFYTHPAEQEPNNSPTEADSLKRVIDGVLATANDTDWYVVSGAPGKLTLESLDSRVALYVVDSAGTQFAPLQNAGQGVRLDTIALPDTLRAPWHCGIYSAYHVAGCRYILGTIAP